MDFLCWDSIGLLPILSSSEPSGLPSREPVSGKLSFMKLARAGAGELPPSTELESNVPEESHFPPPPNALGLWAACKS